MLSDSSGYSYEYIKTIKLTKGKPELIVSHKLKNTGKRRIETTVYNHNFFMIDHQKAGPWMIIRFPFEIIGDGQGVGEFVELQGNEIKFLNWRLKRI